MIFDNWEDFSKKVGVMGPEKLAQTFTGLYSINAPKWDEDGRFGLDQDSKLVEFVRKNPSFHIVTETSDFDDFDHGGYTVSNRYRYVNRLSYYLADGDADDSHELVEEYEEDEFN